MVRIRNSVLSLNLFNEIKKKNRERERDNGILLLRERGKSFGDESNENFEKQTNKLKQINKKQFFHEGYRVRV